MKGSTVDKDKIMPGSTVHKEKRMTGSTYSRQGLEKDMKYSIDKENRMT
jgi:hypothetical protein